MKSKKRSILLISGGLDSSVNLCLGIKKRKIILGITFDYGQKSRVQEIKASKALSKYYQIPHKIIKIDWLKNITPTSLVNKNKKIPKIKKEDFKKKKYFLQTAKQVWVPNRNGVFINIASSFAESLPADTIIVGFNKEEGKTFPDNSKSFLKAVNKSLSYSTLRQVKVESFTEKLNKTQIIEKGIKNLLPFPLIYSCYLGEKKMCGKCESCQRLLRALRNIKKETLLKDRFSLKNVNH
jgi:7-cyano-7-deazaguanine synthase